MTASTGRSENRVKLWPWSACALRYEPEIEGLHLFRTRARCMNCHHGPLFSDGKFHHTGLSYYGRRFEDLGHYEVTRKSADRGKFRTPSLRDLRFTGPWMHNGLFADFSGILRMYNHGMTSGRDPRPGEPELSLLIRPLGPPGQRTGCHRRVPRQPGPATPQPAPAATAGLTASQQLANENATH